MPGLDACVMLAYLVWNNKSFFFEVEYKTAVKQFLRGF